MAEIPIEIIRMRKRILSVMSVLGALSVAAYVYQPAEPEKDIKVLGDALRGCTPIKPIVVEKEGNVRVIRVECDGRSAPLITDPAMVPVLMMRP